MTATNAPLFRLATAPRRAPHKFPFGQTVYVSAKQSISGYPQTERPCANCGVIKVHVIMPNIGAERLWRWPGETAQSPIEPECTGIIP